MSFCQTISRLSGRSYGIGLSRTASTTLKIAVFPPIPRARATTAVSARAGVLASDRAA